MTLQKIDEHLRNTFNLQHILWLNSGLLEGDDTDGHIDTLACFCDTNTIAYVGCDDPQDEHYYELIAMEEELKAFKDQKGQPYNLIKLPMAEAQFDETGNRLPATYANFLIINNMVLMPGYDSPIDNIAATQLQKAFPRRKVIVVNCNALIQQHGSLHCVTMQIPEGFLNHRFKN